MKTKSLTPLGMLSQSETVGAPNGKSVAWLLSWLLPPIVSLIWCWCQDMGKRVLRSYK